MTYTDPDHVLSRAEDAIAAARRAGADAADAHFDSRSSTSISVRLGALEDVGRSEDATLSLRVFVGQRSARVTTSDLSSAAIMDLAGRAVAMASAAPEDKWSGLAPADMLLQGDAPALDLADAGAPTSDRLKLLALAAEDAARAVAGVTNSEGGSAAASDSLSAYATSHGFAGAYRATGYTVSASVLAGEDERMQRDYDWHSARHFADLDDAEAIGRCAGERAVARLDPGTLPSGAMPVLFDPRVAGSLVGHLVAAMAGPMIARGTSFLIGHDNAALFRPGTRISNDPHRPRALKSRPFDAEGLPTAAGLMVDDGRLGPWMLDSASARKLGRQPTGHAARGGQVASANLTFHPGDISRAQLLADVANGVLVTELIGQGIDYVTGDYSRAASGFRIIDGQLAGPVAGFTIAGNLLHMFADLRGADDLDTRGSTHVPTLRTDSLTIAGD
jgi:PmbA protein